MTTGRIVLHDPQSRDYEYPVRRASQGVSVRHAMNAPNVDQFYTSGCVGFSGTNMLNCAMAVRSRQKFNQWSSWFYSTRYLKNSDGLKNYSQSTKRDPFDWVYPPTDEGSSAIGLMKFWKEIGVITRYSWTFSFDGFLAALQRQPVLIGTSWYEGMNSPDRQGIVYNTGTDRGGHEYLANAILWDRRLVGFENSWGEGFGLGGRFYMPFEVIEGLILDRGDCAVPQFIGVT